MKRIRTGPVFEPDCKQFEMSRPTSALMLASTPHGVNTRGYLSRRGRRCTPHGVNTHGYVVVGVEIVEANISADVGLESSRGQYPRIP